MKPQTIKTRKKNCRLLRRILIVGVLALLIAALLAGLGLLIRHALRGGASSSSQPTPTTPPTTTTTTIRTLPAETLDAQLGSYGIVLYDEAQGAVVYSRNADLPYAPASLTKILTAALVCEYADENATFTVGSELSFVAKDASRAGLKAGMTLTRGMLLEAMLLPSGNDAAYTAAVHIARQVRGDASLSDDAAVEAFCGLMNETAARLGCTASHFVNPDGYTAADHFTTPADTLRITQYARTFTAIRETAKKTNVQYTLNGKTLYWSNTNLLMRETTPSGTNPLYCAGTNGLKTGFTSEAGYCVVATAERNGKELIAVVMNAPTSDIRWADALLLLTEGFNALS